MYLHLTTSAIVISQASLKQGLLRVILRQVSVSAVASTPRFLFCPAEILLKIFEFVYAHFSVGRICRVTVSLLPRAHVGVSLDALWSNMPTLARLFAFRHMDDSSCIYRTADSVGASVLEYECQTYCVGQTGHPSFEAWGCS